jgi:thiol-disulfide isomerase/thioredoxin
MLTKHFIFNSPIDVKTRVFKNLCDTIVGKKTFLILVHATWCGHCLHLTESEGQGKKSVWEKLLETYPDVYIVTIEYDAAVEIQKKKNCLLARILSHSVKGFPFIAKISPVDATKTINVYPYDKPNRDLKSLKSFVKSQLV